MDDQDTSNTGVIAVKQPHFLVRATVVVSSVLMVGGLVAYRVGAFDWLSGDKTTTLGGSKSKMLLEPASTEAATTNPGVTPLPEAVYSADDLKLMSSSKAIVLRIPLPSKKPDAQPPSTVPPPTPDAAPPAPIIMWGSKSAPVDKR